MKVAECEEIPLKLLEKFLIINDFNKKIIYTYHRIAMRAESPTSNVGGLDALFGFLAKIPLLKDFGIGLRCSEPGLDTEDLDENIEDSNISLVDLRLCRISGNLKILSEHLSHTELEVSDFLLVYFVWGMGMLRVFFNIHVEPGNYYSKSTL